MNEEQKHYFRCGLAFAKAARLIYEFDEILDAKSQVSKDDMEHWKTLALDIMIFLDDEYQYFFKP